jgi:L-ribulokinase
MNGNRSVLVDHHLSGVVAGLTLATSAPDIYRALIEATAFGTRVIIDAFEGAEVRVGELVIAGGLTRNEMIMQIYADVTRRPLSLIGSAQGPAQGSAIHAAVAAGAYPGVPAAAAAMGSMQRGGYAPDPASAAAYDELYAEYLTLHDYFGRGANKVLPRLRALRDRVLAGRAGAARGAGLPERVADRGRAAPRGDEPGPPRRRPA